jgi:hypothetical protein
MEDLDRELEALEEMEDIMDVEAVLDDDPTDDFGVELDAAEELPGAAGTPATDAYRRKSLMYFILVMRNFLELK